MGTINCYLKVNINNDFVYSILSHWVQTYLSLKDSHLYLLCDKAEIIETIRTQDQSICDRVEILKSMREEPEICEVADPVLSQHWRHAGVAHLTTFWHAKQTGCEAFWNIDADDLFLAAAPEKLASVMKEVQIKAKQEGIHAFSLDMHTSRLRGMHWSFGLTYTDNTIDWFSLMRWYIQPYNLMRTAMGDMSNLDWFFTFLRKKAPECRLESFYIEHLRFIHYCYDFIRRPNIGGIYYCENDRYITPIIRDLLGAKKLGDLPISQDVIKIESDITREESISWLQRFTTVYWRIAQDTDNVEIDVCEFVKPYLDDDIVIDKKTVILVPDTTAAVEPGQQFWTTIAKSLQLFGFRVLTSICPKEKPIDGTEAFAADTEETPRLMEAALAVISVHNDLCDRLAQTDSIIFVIQQSEEQIKKWETTHVNSKAHIVNLLCETPDQTDETAKTIISFFSDAVYGSEV